MRGLQIEDFRFQIGRGCDDFSLSSVEKREPIESGQYVESPQRQTKVHRTFAEMLNLKS